MKRFLIKTGCFLAFVIISIICICEIKVSDASIVAMTAGTPYEKLAWDIEMLNHHPERFDNAIVFVGPSLVQGGVNDSLLSKKGIKGINMGVNHFGYDMDYYVTKRVVENTHPKKIYLFKSQDGGAMLHPMIPMAISPIQYWHIFQQFPLNFISLYYPKRLYFVVRSLIITMTGEKNNYTPTQMYGVREQEETGVSEKIDSNAIDEHKNTLAMYKKNIINEDGTYPTQSSLKKYWRKALSIVRGTPQPLTSYTVTLVKKKGIEVSYLYMPVYYDALIDNLTDDRSYFIKWAGDKEKTLQFANYSFLKDYKLWADYHHLNAKGSAIFADSLANMLHAEGAAE